MSKKSFKSQASSSRAVSGAFGGQLSSNGGFGSSVFGVVPSSPLSYVYEPPDLTGLSEPNVGVAFKNLQKKDGTTKAKALEDLQTYVGALNSEKGGWEDAMLEAWIKVYPRTSIDSSRRVRQLAHTLQGQIALSCGKRIARHMPTVAPSWLAGLYDNDKSVSRAAEESFLLVFPSEEKRTNVWRAYSSYILEYSRSVIVKETVATLSDERAMSPDDASAKYSRVVGTALMLVKTLLENISDTDLSKNQDLWYQFIGEEKLWKVAVHDDSFVRRSIYKLLDVALAKQKKSLDSSLISANILLSGLNASQAGSALDFVKTLSTLSIELPDVWTVHYTGSGKKSAHNRLSQCLKKGSQGGPPEFWSCISNLLSNLPTSILINTNENLPAKESSSETQPHSNLLEALLEGLNRKDEGRFNQSSAWNTYINAFELVQTSVLEPINRQQFYTDYLYPIIKQYVNPSPERSQWTVSCPQQKVLCLRACNIALLEDPKHFKQEWQVLSTNIIESMKTSLPEQSKEYLKSQDSFSAQTMRWYQLQASLLIDEAEQALRLIMKETLPSEIASAIAVLKNRNGKPYGAAAALDQAVQAMPDMLLGNEQIRKVLLDFANSAIPELVLSRSFTYLAKVLDALADSDNVTHTYARCMQTLAEAPESEAKSDALITLISSPGLATNQTLIELVQANLRHALQYDDDKSWNLVVAAINNPMLPKPVTDDVLVKLTDGLSIHAESHPGLHGLELIRDQREGLIKDFALSNAGSGLFPALLLLSEASDQTVVQRATRLSTLLERKMGADGSSGQATKSMLHIIEDHIANAGVGSLSVDVLVSQAQRTWEQTLPEEMPNIAARLLPDAGQWNSAIRPFLLQSPNPSLAITNSFGGSISLITNISPDTIQRTASRGTDGYSSLFRVTKYGVKLINSTKIFDYITNEQRTLLCKHLALFIQLASDELSVPGDLRLWDSLDSDQESEVVDFVAEAQSLLASWFQGKPSATAFVEAVQDQLLHDSYGHASSSYYSARAYSAMTTEIVEVHGHKGHKNDADRLKAMRKSADVFAAVACLTSAPFSKDIQRLCNELLADLTGYSFGEDTAEGVRKLVLISSIFRTTEDLGMEIPQQRLVFFVKHAVQQLQKLEPGSFISGQTVLILSYLLPAISEIYGDFWADILDIIEKTGLQDPSDETLFGIHGSLRLLQLLRKPHMQQANDDLLDAWNEKKRAIQEALLGLMTRLAGHPDESHQPRRIVNELLSKQLPSLQENFELDSRSLYPVLASGSTVLQETGYELLHKDIPSAQEQISVEKALSKDYLAELPQELLSLTLTPPSMAFLAEANFERSIPSVLRSYLLSWKLTFDHWQNASYNVQSDYVAALQEGTYVTDFLTFALNVLITARTKPVDASKFDISTYRIREEESPEKETHWLLIHLYYLCLHHLPSITKTWWRDSASRQLNIAVESWTEKYISPLIIASELSTISDWAPSQATADQPMTVKVSLSAREITASIPVDEQTMAIAIHLPKTYPLARAEVTSVHRVGVAEKKWNSWLINTQGVINFSSGGAGEGNALIDGLMAWRKNVTAAMKGQTECAICYSVVSADRQLPSKKCQTCKNTFHSSCLFRWFKSSNSSSCPLCRNAFNYS